MKKKLSILALYIIIILAGSQFLVTLPLEYICTLKPEYKILSFRADASPSGSCTINITAKNTWTTKQLEELSFMVAEEFQKKYYKSTHHKTEINLYHNLGDFKKKKKYKKVILINNPPPLPASSSYINYVRSLSNRRIRHL